MDGYRLVLFLHLCALLGAIATSTLLHFAEVRLRAADTVAAVRLWAGLIEKGARVFPLALLVLLGSGAYLVERSWAWSSGWVEASLGGVAVLFVVGAGVIGGRSRALRRELANAGEGAVPAALAQITREHVGGVASWTNTGLALGIVFVMTTKPALAGSLAALGVAAGLGAVTRDLLARGIPVATVAPTQTDLDLLEQTGANHTQPPKNSGRAAST